MQTCMELQYISQGQHLKAFEKYCSNFKNKFYKTFRGKSGSLEGKNIKNTRGDSRLVHSKFHT